ncbi:MAG TPA: Gfo/Idh/MocA family oxidoreductase [Candidatus Limnocylindrales bacterium]|nr:Gfo/Idh/MocA family oxidoreductase [Candidatus Limnocylindrales bacterium]
MTAVAPARVGIVGCGNVSEQYVTGCASLSAVELAACADLDPARAAALSARGGFPATSFEALVDDPTIEVILNLTPPIAHTDVSRAAIAAGKHVYSEKPFATTRDDARAILAEAAARGLRVGGAPDTFLGGGLQTARAVLDSGAIGEPIGANAAVLHLGPERWHPNPGIFFGLGGGPLLDVGPYYVAALVSMLGPIREVSAVGRGVGGRRLTGSGPRAGETFEASVPTYAISAFTFASGVVGGFMASFDVVASRSPHIEIHGTEGSLSLGDPNMFDGEVLIHRLDGEAWEPVTPQPGGQSGRGLGLAEMIEAIRAERPHRASGELAFHVLDVLLATEKAIGGGPVEVRSTVERPEPLAAGTPARVAGE